MLMHWFPTKFLSTISLKIKVQAVDERKMDSRNNLHSFCDWATKTCSTHWDKWYWCVDFIVKVFFSPFTLESKFLFQMRQTLSLIIISVLFMISHHNKFFSLGCMMLMLWFPKKSVCFTRFLRIKVHLSNRTNIDTHNNLHFFISHEKILLPQFSSESKLIHEMR